MLMSFRKSALIAVLWMASLVGVATFARGQAFAYRPLPEPKILSGDDLGFRVTGMHGAVPAGVLVVRINGEWVEVTSAPGMPTVRPK
jgi:hypothetical protein